VRFQRAAQKPQYESIEKDFIIRNGLHQEKQTLGQDEEKLVLNAKVLC
jgi:hypothetical protein